jgi:hypothetical protein
MKHRFIDLTKVFFRRTEGRLRVLRAIRLLKIHLNNYVKMAFSDARDAENEFAWPITTWKHRFIDLNKAFLYTFRMQIFNSEDLSPT